MLRLVVASVVLIASGQTQAPATDRTVPFLIVASERPEVRVHIRQTQIARKPIDACDGAHPIWRRATATHPAPSASASICAAVRQAMSASVTSKRYFAPRKR